jgi:hypothetical protein
VKPDFTDDPVAVEHEEIERLAELLVNEEQTRDVNLNNWRRSEVVKFVLDNYRPRVAWYKIEPDPGEPVYLQTTFYVCQLRVGSRLLKYNFPWREGRQHPLDDNAWHHLRRQMLSRLGAAFARWADGQEEEERPS